MVSAAFFDADGTKFRWHTMPTLRNDLARESLAPTDDDELHAKLLAYRNREGSFREYEKSIVPSFQRLLAGKSVEDVRIVAERLVERQLKRVYVFTRELLAVIHQSMVPSFLVSGGPEPVISIMAKRLGFVDYLATAYPHQDGVYTGEAPEHWVHRKAEAVQLLAERHKIDLGLALAIGDTMTDVGMLAAVRWPICFNPTRELYDLADHKGWPVVIERKDLILCTVKDKGDRSPRHVCGLHNILPDPWASALEQRFVDIRYL